MANEEKRSGQEAPATSQRQDDIDFAAGNYLTFAEEDNEDKKRLRVAIVLGAIFHTILLATPVREIVAEQMDVKKERKLFVVRQIPFQPPPPKQKKEIPRPQAMKVPIPDPTPDEPEPIRIEEPEPDIDLPQVADIVFGIPDAPPVAEPEGPIYVGGDVKPPTKLQSPQPQYTEIARKARVQGVVIVQAIIDKQGNVTNVKVLRGLSMGLDDEAVKAIKKWKFEPATLNGKPVDVYYNLTVNFRLQ